MSLFQKFKRGGTMNDKKRTLDELLEAIEKCKKAQIERKKRQQQYRINKYYEKKEAERNENAKK